MLIDSSKPSTFLCRAAALALFTGASVASLYAQQPGSIAVPNAAQAATPQLDLKHIDLSSLDLADADGVGYSSSATPAVDPEETATLDFKGLEAMQPPPRRRYGRPRYNDSSHNADGSNKYTFYAGVGLTLPTGNLHEYDKPSYSFQVGAGRNFNKHFAANVQFDWDNFGLQGSTLNNELNLYNDADAGLSSLDGNSHIWSFTVDPQYNFYAGDKMGAYVIAGVGFYHKVTTFTVPEEGLVFDGFGEEEIEENATFDHYTSNAVGFNGGFGLTYKPSRFANERFYAEARYVYVDNAQRQGYTAANAFTTTYNGYNFYPANSNKSEYIPIKFGIRF